MAPFFIAASAHWWSACTSPVHAFIFLRFYSFFWFFLIPAEMKNPGIFGFNINLVIKRRGFSFADARLSFIKLSVECSLVRRLLDG
jgi:hypothetical protein